MKRWTEIVIHLLFWSLVVSGLLWLYAYLVASVAAAFGAMPDFNFVTFTQVLIPFLSVCMLVFYFYYFILIPKYFNKKGIARFVLYSFVSFLVSTFLFGVANLLTKNGTFLEVLSSSWLFFLISAVIGSLLKGAVLWIRSVAEKKAIQKNHLESKIALLLLKAQLNPHFLFNSLNNIDVLIEDNPRIASEYLKKLCDILRYVLYETKEDKVALSSEVSQIISYIEMQKIRTDNDRYVRFNVQGALSDQKVAPMIFLPFVENAFKHSKNKTIDNAIDISFDIQGNNVTMGCKNYFEPSKVEVLKNEGLGIDTIRQRLTLLYPGKHWLNIEQKDNWFNVTLSIHLNNDH